MRYIYHPDLMGLFQTVHVPRLFAPVWAKKRDGAVGCVPLRAVRENRAHFPSLGFPSDE